MHNFVHYHKRCNDGMGAAVAMFQQLANHKVTFLPIEHGGTITVSEGGEFGNVWLLDYCPTYDDLLNLLDVCYNAGTKVFIFDHHETAFKVIAKLLYENPKSLSCLHYRFDDNFSGAEICSQFRRSTFAHPEDLNDIPRVIMQNSAFTDFQKEHGFECEHHVENLDFCNGGERKHVTNLPTRFFSIFLTQCKAVMDTHFVHEFELFEMIGNRDLWRDVDKDTKREADCLFSGLVYHNWSEMPVAMAAGFLRGVSEDTSKVMGIGRVIEDISDQMSKNIIDNALVEHVSNTVHLCIAYNPEYPSKTGSMFCNDLHPDEPALYVNVSVNSELELIAMSMRSNTHFNALDVVKNLELRALIDSGGGHLRACGARSKQMFKESPGDIARNIIKSVQYVIDEKFVERG